MMQSIQQSKLYDVAFFGVRAAAGVIFILHGLPKFNPGFSEFLANIGMPPEAQIPIALLEVVGGAVLIAGTLSRIAASILAMNMLGAIFVVKEASSITGQGGYELDLILLAVCLLIIASGPGRYSASRLVKGIPRFLQ